MGHLRPKSSSVSWPNETFGNHHSVTPAHSEDTRAKNSNLLLWSAHSDTWGGQANTLSKFQSIISSPPLSCGRITGQADFVSSHGFTARRFIGLTKRLLTVHFWLATSLQRRSRVLDELHMTVQEHPATAAAVNGATKQSGNNGRNGFREIWINHEFDIGGAVDGADGRVVGGLEISDGL